MTASGTGRARVKSVAALGALVAALAGASHAHAAFPGENGRIFFSSDRDGEGNLPQMELYSMRPDGTDVKRLTNTAGGEYSPAASADGRWIVYSYIPGAGEPGPGEARIEIRRADGTARRELTASVAGRDDWAGGFAPDGQTVTFTREPAGDGSGELWLVDSDGTDARSIDPALSDTAYEPTYTPDGESVVFAGSFAGGGTRIYSVVPGEPLATPASPASPRGSYEPSVSPDGSRVAFDRGEDFGAESFQGIFSSTLSAEDLETVLAPAGPFQSYGAAYSPNGQRIVYSRYSEDDPDRSTQLFSIALGGGQPTRLTESGPDSDYADWAPAVRLPSVLFSKKPRKRTGKRRANFRMKASPRGATVACRLDRGPWRRCRVGRKNVFSRLKPGKHVFRARATASGETGPTLDYTETGPTRTFRWKVRR